MKSRQSWAELYAFEIDRAADAPAKRKQKMIGLPPAVMARVFAIMTFTAVTGSIVFNFTTNGNGELLRERVKGAVQDPAELAMMLFVIFSLASLAQLVVGKLTAIGFMLLVFGAIPFTDTMIVKYIDDRMRSRVTGARLAIGFGVSPVVVALIGPLVKAAGFPVVLMVLAGCAFLGFCAISMLPGERDMSQATLKPAE